MGIPDESGGLKAHNLKQISLTRISLIHLRRDYFRMSSRYGIFTCADSCKVKSRKGRTACCAFGGLFAFSLLARGIKLYFCLEGGIPAAP